MTASCPRCRKGGIETLHESDAWQVLHCPSCSFAWRTSEDELVTDPDRRPERFQLDAAAIAALRTRLPRPAG
jgi:Zn ribbon nucleic-acid-binding protein